MPLISPTGSHWADPGQVTTAMEWPLSKLIRTEKGSVVISGDDLWAILWHYEIINRT